MMIHKIGTIFSKNDNISRFVKRLEKRIQSIGGKEYLKNIEGKNIPLEDTPLPDKERRMELKDLHSKNLERIARKL